MSRESDRPDARDGAESPDSPPPTGPTGPTRPSDEATEPAGEAGGRPSAVKSPELTEKELERAERETPLNADIIYEVIRRRGEGELARPLAALFYSGLAAGLSMGFSLVAEGLLKLHLPAAPWTVLMTKLGYSVGFLMITLGSQQLFTENTLTAIIPLLSRWSRQAFVDVARLWAVVLAANLLGAGLFAVGLAHTPVLEPPVHRVLLEIALLAAEGSWLQLFLQGIFAGWLIALMVWMLPATQGGQAWVVVTMTYLIGLGGFPHIIAGSVEVLYAVAANGLSWTEYVLRYAPATLAGNVVGGVALVSALNYAQVIAGGGRRRDRAELLMERGRWPLA